ncbi:MAG: hypothetical protein V1903_08140, partial [Bacteroidota bacterium]
MKKFPFRECKFFPHQIEFTGRLFQSWLIQDLKKYLKSLYSLALLFIVSVSLSGQVSGDYQTTGSGNWSNNAIWEVHNGTSWNPCGALDYPGAAAGTQTVNIRNGHTVTMDVSPLTIGALTFANNSTASGLVINGQTLSITGAVTFGAPTANPGDQTITLGTGTINCASISMPSTGNAGWDLLITGSDGIINATGNIIMTGGSDRNNIVFSGAGVINVGGHFTGGGFTCGTSTVNYNGGTQNIGPYTYYNLTISGTDNNKTLQGSIIIGGTLAVNAGTLDFSNFGVRTVSVAGNLSGTGAIDMASGGSLAHQMTLNGASNSIGNFICGSGTVIYSGNVAQQIFGGTYYNLTTQTNNQVRTIQGDIVVNNNLTITLGTFDFGNSVARNVIVSENLSGAGAIDMSGGVMAHSLTLDGVSNSIGTFTTTDGSGSTVNYTRIGDQGVFVSTRYQNLNIGGGFGGIKTFSAGSPVTINGNLDVAAGTTLAYNAAAARTLNVTGNLSGDGTIDMSSGSFGHTLNLGGSLNYIGALTTAPGIASAVNYNRN